MARLHLARSGAALALLAAAVTGCSSDPGGGKAHPPRAAATSSAAAAAPSPNPLATSPAPAGDPSASAIDSYLRGLVQKGRFTGSITVVRRGQVLARFAAGKADSAKNIPNSPDTIFRIASVSKQFTAMLVLKLQDEGKVKLDDTVCPYLVPTYIKSCPSAWKPITIREILVHTSGIPDISEMPDFFPKLGTPTTPKEIISRFVHKPLDFKPGTGWKYSNSGYILAGAIIEKVTGKKFGDVLHAEIAAPLGLQHTGYTDGDPPDGWAKGYLSVGKPAGHIIGSEAYAAGGVYTTADDLTRWDRSFGAHLVAPAATVKLAFTPQADCPSGGCLDSPSTGYAFGWLVDRLRGHRYLYHPGLLEGYHASNVYLPDDDIAIAVLSNVQDTDVNGIARHLAELTLNP
ncbi:serine hydrolase domain-containing protein [Actinoallomurus rhizosphaericola]|uniref:serine hydrolase domain-containing protein n=1 Tax=Actinoallomurus rhizosphaericola TaxID=2952536 RepID=UPI002092481C|nr:serine hydrolase domain-containing protein [Actinoallomurus rhizosphaericola]MCO5998338.1 beta-lactamase family protein [Actinoallomurus rhizosphaericola]